MDKAVDKPFYQPLTHVDKFSNLTQIFWLEFVLQEASNHLFLSPVQAQKAWAKWHKNTIKAAVNRYRAIRQWVFFYLAN